ncbi:MAG: hypothetical protein R3325_13370 [Thermoanaerobaculia bacterium]|nr:hypothetical protein [Thermoanaerobaculia bacterium]
MARKLSKKEETYLKRYAKGRTRAELAQRMETDVATIEEALERLELAAKDSPQTVRYEDDPLVQVYEKGITAIGKQKWAEAVRHLEQVAAESDQPPLAARARHYLKLAEERRGKDADEGADPFLEAVVARNAGNLDEALEICRRGGRQSRTDNFAYLAASIYAVKEDVENAAKSLSTAIELDPKNRVRAHFDRDFDPVRENPEIAGLLARP